MSKPGIDTVAEAHGDSPIATRTRTRGTSGAVGSSNTTTSKPRAPRAQRNKIPETPAPTFIHPRRWAPPPPVDDARSPSSLPSIVPYNSQLTEYPSPSLADTPHDASPALSRVDGNHGVVGSIARSDFSDGTHLSHGTHLSRNQIGRARALEKGLPRLRETASELHQLLCDPRRNSQLDGQDDDQDPVWAGEVEATRKMLSALRSSYCGEDAPFITDEDISLRLGRDYGTDGYETAKIITCIANLAELMFIMHSSKFERDRPFLEILDKSFPGSFTLDSLLRSDEWENATVELAIDIRTQYAISMLHEADSDVSVIHILAQVFCDGVGDEHALEDRLQDPGCFRGISVESSHHPRFSGLKQTEQAHMMFYERYKDLRTMLEASNDTVNPGILAQIEEVFPYAGFIEVLHPWIGNITSELVEIKVLGSQTPSRPQTARLNTHQSLYSPHNSAAMAAQAHAVQAFIHAGLPKEQNGRLEMSPAPGSSVSNIGPSRPLKRPREDDEEDDFEQDPRSLADGQAMPPPPRTVNRRGRGGSAPRVKRIQPESQPPNNLPQIPVDPSLMGGTAAEIAAAAALSDIFATPARSQAMSDAGSFAPSEQQEHQQQPPESSMPNIAQMSQRSRDLSALARSRQPRPVPTPRVRWTDEDCQQLVRAVGAYEAKWSKMAEAVKLGELHMSHMRDQQALRDKARLLKQDILKTDRLLPPGFDLVLLGKKEMQAVQFVGKNPHRTEADVNPNTGQPVNTDYRAAGEVPADAAAAQDHHMDDSTASAVAEIQSEVDHQQHQHHQEQQLQQHEHPMVEHEQHDPHSHHELAQSAASDAAAAVAVVTAAD